MSYSSCLFRFKSERYLATRNVTAGRSSSRT